VGCASAFGVLFSLHLGLTLTQLGQIAGWSSVVSIWLLYPAGMLSDRIHPLRVALAVALIYVPLYSVQLIYLFVDVKPNIVLAIAIAHAAISLPVATMWNVAELPMYMRLLPRERYGQFASANALVRSAAVIFGSVVAGGFLDMMRRVHGGSDFAYRYIPVWQVTFFALSLFFFYRLYRAWKARGGMQGYVPPEAQTHQEPIS
jgi:maltose/moltooligosaccharide transporter